MIADLKPYPAMKDSGIEWLGDVPDHWEVLLNQRLFRETTRPYAGTGETQLSLSQRDGLVPTAEMTERSLQTESYDNWKIVLPSDLVLNRFKAHLGVFFAARVRGIVTFHYGVFRSKEAVEMKYFELLFHTPSYRAIYGGRSNGMTVGLQNLSNQNFYNVRSVVPPVHEQAAIVRFLDHADRRIRRYIRAKQKLIKLLGEQKQAIIHRAVTHGLDPNVRLKPSGVEWLGDVPEHWSVKRLKFLVRVTSGQIDPRAPEHRRKILIAPNHIKSGAGRLAREETAEEQGADSGKYEVRRGQVVYSKIRPNLRKAAIARLDCLCSADMYPLTVRESQLRPEFLLLLLLSVPFTRFVMDCSLRVAMPKVNREALGEGWLWYPDLKEQEAILRWTQASTAPLDAAIGQAEREIALLREYRTRLIADVVTGKLDVREAAARLPDEVEEPEPLDENREESEGNEIDQDEGNEASCGIAE